MRRVTLLATLAFAVACGGHDKDDEDKKAPSRVHGREIVLDDKSRAAIDLAVAPATEADLPDIRLRYGKAIARPGDELVVSSPMVGRVTQLAPIAIGDHVTTGTEIARISPVLNATERASAGVQTAEIGAQIAQAQQEVGLREAELARAKDLARDGIVSQAKLQEAEAAAAGAHARLEASRQGRDAHAGAVGRIVTLTVPADGTLVSLEAVSGGTVDLGQAVARVLRAGPRRIDLSVSASDPTASAYEVQIADAWLAARLISRGTTVGEDGNRHDILELDASAGALLGSVVAVRLATAPARGIVVADSAVLPSAGGDVVYVEPKHGTFELRLVRIAARFGGRVRLTTGVKVGESVVVRGASALRGEALRSSLGGEDTD